ncbi:MAG: hypothetical protein K2I43_02575, partial [Alistipes sp.]|nr:hypothetical protein [Alistipes sp.]
MKKIILSIIFVLAILNIYGQNADSTRIQIEPLTNLQRDSLLTSIQQNVYIIAEDATNIKNQVGRYKIYRT